MEKQQQRKALVTGGMGGLGASICERLASMGYLVITTYSPSNEHATDWLQCEADDGFQFRAYCIDVSNYESCAQGVAKITADVGTVDVLVNNAGITRDTSFRKMNIEDWNTVIATDLNSVFHMTKQVIEGMVTQGFGRIINISSVNGQKGAFGQTNYAAAKAGIHGFTKSLALELAQKGITVNTVSPGYLNTSMLAAIPADIMNNKILPQIPVGRLGKPSEIAGLVAYLASEEAAFITGANIAINGGQHMF
jgi:acetoacetyl-CoA reductase